MKPPSRARRDSDAHSRRATGFALFHTAIGGCGLAWGGQGVVGVQLPEASDHETLARLVARCPNACEAPLAPPASCARDEIAAHLRGEPADFDRVALDMEELPPFHRRVYEAARDIPRSQTRTYGELATLLGAPGAARAVGQALGRNPFAIVVPCHRVLTADGKAGGFSAHGGIAAKFALLAIEGARLGDSPALSNFARI